MQGSLIPVTAKASRRLPDALADCLSYDLRHERFAAGEKIAEYV